MNDRPDAAGVDLERELARYMAEHRITRRMLLEQVAKVGAFAAFAPIIAACAGGAASSAPSVAPTVSAAPPIGRAERIGRRGRPPTPAPTPPPVPETELFIYNYAELHRRGRHPVASFEKIKYRTTRSTSRSSSGLPRHSTRGSTRASRQGGPAST